MPNEREARSTVDQAEVDRFASMAGEWWDPRGKMAPLHKFNPARIEFIRECVCDHYGRDPARLDWLDGLRILDVGCGGGLLAEPLARLGGRVVGIDPAAENVAVARAHAEASGVAVEYRADTIEAALEKGERFDLVIASEVIEHVPDVPRFVAHCADAVSPGGLFIVTTISRTLKSFALAIVGAEYVLRWLPVGTHTWSRFVTPDEAERAIGQAGLEVSDETGIVYDPLRDQWRFSSDMDVNYALCARKNIVLAAAG